MSMPRKIPCTVASLTDHGGRVYTVDLLPASPVPSFRPGQFLHLTVDDYDPSGFWPESRVFSIASSPRDRTRVRICYSVKGCYTTKMEQTLQIGSEVWIKLPYGDFVINDAPDAILIAGGTGISAFTAFLEALTPENPRRVTLVYGTRSPSLFLFQDMILRQIDTLPQFQVLLFSETPDPVFAAKMSSRSKAPNSFTGRISLNTVLQYLISDFRPQASDFYLSGPPVMLKALGMDLQTRGVPPKQIRTDAWE